MCIMYIHMCIVIRYVTCAYKQSYAIYCVHSDVHVIFVNIILAFFNYNPYTYMGINTHIHYTEVCLSVINTHHLFYLYNN